MECQKTLENATENENYKELVKLRGELHSWFRYSYEGRVSAEKLYQKGTAIAEKAKEVNPRFYEVEGLENFSNALEFVEQLHDKSIRDNATKRPELLYIHLIGLS
ncbi:hypothetical protein J4217_02545 [Candidatus Pacearchaeota archaeon]|nr:hypothetical protein [Candidatus Pacearchaeota archaeon]